MSRLFRFNPEHEIALSADRAEITAPRRAAMLRKSCSAIMGWLGETRDYIAIEIANDVERHRAEKWLETFGRPLGYRAMPLFIRREDMGKRSRFAMPDEISSLNPWGWDRNAATIFRRLGVPERLLPTEPFLTNVRNAAHRRISATLTESVVNATEPSLLRFISSDIPQESSNIQVIEKLLGTRERIFTKLPYSSSGRGVIDSATLPRKAFLQQIEGQIKLQGSVMVERAFDKAEDFAMLFRVDNGIATFSDFSLFFTHRSTGYGGNLILSSDEIKSRLSRYIPAKLLERTAIALSSALSALLPEGYCGMAGVDMMIARQEGAHILVPCVELNLRYTMGMVAAALSRRPKLCGKSMMILPPGHPFPVASVPLVPPNEWFNIAAV